MVRACGISPFSFEMTIISATENDHSIFIFSQCQETDEVWFYTWSSHVGILMLLRRYLVLAVPWLLGSVFHLRVKAYRR